MHWCSFKIFPPGKLVFMLMMIVEITTWWKILSNLIKEDFKVAKDSHCRRRN